MLRRLLAQRLAQIERQIARVDATMQALTSSDTGLVERLDNLISIPSISIISATALLADIPELGTTERKLPPWPAWRQRRANRVMARS